jgi:hypothetical protein
LNALISCAFANVPASLLSRGNIATIDSVEICNYTKGDGSCGTTRPPCHHTPGSCHYTGDAVDFNAPSNAQENQLYQRLLQIQTTCKFGGILFEGDHIHVSTINRNCSGI